jgi:hypothetical protein
MHPFWHLYTFFLLMTLFVILPIVAATLEFGANAIVKVIRAVRGQSK